VSPTLHEYSMRTNKLSYWVAYQLISEPKLKSRSKILDHFIKIAIYLLKLHNYQSLMSFYLAINIVTFKLSQTFKLLRPKTLSIWKRISTLMSPIDNFSQYRETVKSVDPPFIPCQEVILKDLLYHDVSIPDFFENGVWNFKKLRVIGKILHQFRMCQECPYNFLPLNDLQELLNNIPDITNEQLDVLPIDSEISEFKSVSTSWGERREFTSTDSDTAEDFDSSLILLSNQSNNTIIRRSGSVGSDSGTKANRTSSRKKARSKIFILNEGTESFQRRSLKREKIPFNLDDSQSSSNMSPNRKDNSEN